MSAEDRAHLDGLKEEVKQLRETNKDLAARLEKQSGALETLKMLTDTYDKRVEKVREDMSWQTNALNNVVQYFSDQLTRQQTTISNLAWQIIILNLKSSDNGEAVFDAADSTGFSYQFLGWSRGGADHLHVGRRPVGLRMSMESRIKFRSNRGLI